ncbi:uncharacterized protein ACN2A1_005680 [Glossina fuscipes fuscipes]
MTGGSDQSKHNQKVKNEFLVNYSRIEEIGEENCVRHVDKTYEMVLTSCFLMTYLLCTYMNIYTYIYICIYMRYISVKYGCALNVRAFMNAYGSRSYNYSFYQWVGITATMEILTKNTYVTKLAFFMILRFMIITRFSKRPNSNARENQIHHYDTLPANGEKVNNNKRKKCSEKPINS